MSRNLRFNTVDVFAEKMFEGNQLAIVHIPSGTALGKEKEQSIAVEYNLSETVFLEESNDESKYVARIYTPQSELPFAGHPTIGTLCWIFSNLATSRSEISLMLKAGEVKAKYDRQSKTAVAEIPHDVRIHQTRLPWNRVEWSQPGLASKGGATVPIASPVKEMNFALVDLSFQSELLANVIVTDKDLPTAKDLDDGWPSTLLANLYYYLKPDQGDGVIRCRQRMIGIGLEDPATGSASCALASYLALQQGEGGKTYRFELEQGVEMGRRSVIGVSVTLKGDGQGIAKVSLSGQSIEVMEGTLRTQ